MKTADLVSDSRALLGEGPLWDDEKKILYWLDIFGKRLHCFDPLSMKDSPVETGVNVACIAFAGTKGFMAGTSKGFQLLNPADGRLEPVFDPEASEPENRFNDGKVDPSGRFVAGTMSTKGEIGRGCLYSIDRDMRVVRLLEGLSISNGLDWSPDGRTLYLVDSAIKCVFAFDYAFDYTMECPRLANRRVVIDAGSEIDTKLLDGMSIDQEGMLWICHFGAGQVVRWDPRTGRKLDTVSIPAPKATSCAFGGAGMKTLFITSASTGLDGATLSAWPHSGGVFAVECPVGGFRARVFGTDSSPKKETAIFPVRKES